MTDACSREVEEETGLAVEARQIVAVVERRIEGFHYIIIDFLACLLGPESQRPRAESDVSDAQWVDLARLGDYPLVEGLEEIIQRSHRIHTLNRPAGLAAIGKGGFDYVVASGLSIRK